MSRRPRKENILAARTENLHSIGARLVCLTHRKARLSVTVNSRTATEFHIAIFFLLTREIKSTTRNNRPIIKYVFPKGRSKEGHGRTPTRKHGCFFSLHIEEEKRRGEGRNTIKCMPRVVKINLAWMRPYKNSAATSTFSCRSSAKSSEHCKGTR